MGSFECVLGSVDFKSAMNFVLFISSSQKCISELTLCWNMMPKLYHLFRFLRFVHVIFVVKPYLYALSQASLNM